MTPTRDQFRRVMGRFATGVTVITTRAGDEMHGMTANAVTSLSLDPMLVLVCVDKAADTHDIISHARMFAVNILSKEQAEISNRFAQKDREEAHDLDGVAYHLSESGLPLIEGSIAHLECRTMSEVEGGDHTIFIGEVTKAEDSGAGEPLLFYQGRYGRFVEP